MGTTTIIVVLAIIFIISCLVNDQSKSRIRIICALGIICAETFKVAYSGQNEYLGLILWFLFFIWNGI